MRRTVIFVGEFAIAAALQWSGYVNHAASAGMWALAVLIGAVLLITSPEATSRAVALRRSYPMLSTLIASGIGAVVFGVGWQVLSRLSQPAPEPAPFGVGVRSAVIHDSPEPLSLFMVGYPSLYGQTVSPVIYLVHIHIVNMQNTPKTIEGYSVAISDSPEGPWQTLSPIPLASTALYSLSANSTSPRTLIFSRGAYRLATPMKRKDMIHAALLNPVPKLDEQLARPVAPYETVAGWAAFDLPDHGVKVIRNYFRITVRDTTKTTFSDVVEVPSAKPGDSENDTQTGRIEVAGPVVDISSYRVKYYSDPYRRPDSRR